MHLLYHNLHWQKIVHLVQELNENLRMVIFKSFSWNWVVSVGATKNSIFCSEIEYLCTTECMLRSHFVVFVHSVWNFGFLYLNAARTKWKMHLKKHCKCSLPTMSEKRKVGLANSAQKRNRITNKRTHSIHTNMQSMEERESQRKRERNGN